MATMQERRKRPRGVFPGRVQLSLFPSGLLDASPLNLSEGGICLRLKQALEVSARVQVRLFAKAGKQPHTCAGRVAWVVERLDLRTTPLSVYDVGVEFVKPVSRLRQLTTDRSTPTTKRVAANGRASLEPVMIHDRRYIPSLQRELPAQRRPSGPSGVPEPVRVPARDSWHLIVRVDGAPCFAKRFASQREAIGAWGTCQRQLMRREAR